MRNTLHGLKAFYRSLVSEAQGSRLRARSGLQGVAGADISVKFAKYFVVGGICALGNWIFFALLLYLAGFHYLVAAAISFVFVTALNYGLSIRFVFVAGRHGRGTEITLVVVASVIGALIDLAVLSGLIEYLSMHPMLAKAIGTASALGWNFGVRYLWIFHR